MVKARTSRRQAVEMGQTSSQLGPSTPLEPADDQDAPRRNSKGRKHRKKTETEKSTKVVEHNDDEEGIARALIQLSADAVLDTRLPSQDDDLAASAQLMAESSPVRPLRSFEVGTYAEGQEKHRSEKKSNKRKRGRESSVVLPNNSKILSSGEERLQIAQNSLNGHKHLRMSPSEFPRSSFSLDDIDSNDEAVASYLQEYENGVNSHPSPNVSRVNNSEPKHPDHRAAVGYVVGSSDNARHSIYRTPSPTGDAEEANRRRKRRGDQLVKSAGGGNHEPLDEISRPSNNLNDSSVRTQKHKRKRQKATDSALDSSFDEHQGLLSSTGQHICDHDFEAFDQYMVENGLDLANPSERDPGYAMPIDPQLIREPSLAEQANQGTLLDLDDDVARQTSRKGKLKRVSSQPRKSRALPPPKTNGDGSPYMSPYASKGDSQRQQSPELEFSQSVRVGGTGRYSTGGISHPNAIASKSKKRSKSLGTTPGNFERGRNKHQPSIQEITEKGGMFTEAEVAKLDAFRDRYCEENDLTAWQYNELIHANMRGNHKVTRLFLAMYEVLPYRRSVALQRFCRRHYHNFSARGTWTKEEDVMLKQAVAEKGKSWKAVGEMVERLPEDCRDRWRNYLITGDNRNTDKWTDAEIRNLVIAVHDCIKTMRETRRVEKEEKYDGRDLPVSEPDSNEEAEEMKLINWQAVSDRMGENGGGRSRLQCSHKYSILKSADRRKYMRQIKEGAEAMRRLEEGLPQKKSSMSNDGWRLRKATRRAANMKIGDKYDLLQVLSTCNAPEEANIPWKYLGDSEFQAKWSRLERVAAWEVMKKQVPGSEKMDYHDVVNRLLTRMMAEDFEHLDERWDPEVDGDVNKQDNLKRLAMKEEIKSKNKKKAREKRKDEGGVKGVKPKSAKFVSASDEDDLDMDEDNQQHSEADLVYEMQNSSKVRTASNTEDELQDLHAGDVAQDAEEFESQDEVEETAAEESGEETEHGNGNVSGDSGDGMQQRMQLLRNA